MSDSIEVTKNEQRHRFEIRLDGDLVGLADYRDDDRIYRVDSNTRKILAVINLIDAFSN